MTTFVERLQMLVDEHADGKPAIFAKKAGILGGTFHAYMNGRLPQAEQLIRIHKFCGVNINWLLTGEGEHYMAAEKKIAVNGQDGAVVDIQHSDLVKNFKDKHRAKKINENLLEIERLSPRVFEKVDQYISDTADTVRLSVDDSNTGGEVADGARKKRANGQ